MITKPIENLIIRALLVAGAISVALAFAEGLAQLLGASLVARMYGPARLLEIGGVLFVFSIALLLRQIRDQLASNQD